MTPAAAEDQRKRRISVCALVPYPLNTTPSQRYRLEQWRPELERHGISLELRPFVNDRLMALLHRRGHKLRKLASGLRAWLARAAGARSLRGFDAVVIHRGASIFGPAVLERLFHALGARIIFDFDDAIYLLHTSAANRALGWLKFPGKTATLCRLSRHVVVANEELAGYARRHNSRVSLVPSSVDTDLYRPTLGPRGEGPLRVGWTGSSTSLTYLEMFAPTLRALVQRHAIELHVHSDRAPELAEVPHVWHRWSAETEVAELARFDVGIMPMPEDEWARGKSAMKALLYMAVGVPAVCSPVGTNRTLIRHGENGLLARSAEEWLDAIGALAADPELRCRLGRGGRETVERGYSKRHCAARFAEVVREAVA